VAPAAVSERVRRVAERLPPQVRLGTSTWSFPGWAGIVYDKERSPRDLAKHGLAAYAQHPTLRAAGVDRTFYAPMSVDEYRDYAEAVHDGFRFLVKANRACTFPTLKPRGARAEAPAEPNELFMNPQFAVHDTIAPAVRGLGAKLGVVLFQFPPLPRRVFGSPDAFADQLHVFLSMLPREAPIAVELRNEELCVPRYAAAIADLPNTSHCFVVHPSAAGVQQQADVVSLADQQQIVCRWMLHAGQSYMGAKGRYEPFDRLVDPDPASRAAYVDLIARAVSRSMDVIVVANNKAEGSAPMTVMKLAEEIVESDEGRSA
jgi:uncharacterized protein YecE (DUF72 family)